MELWDIGVKVNVTQVKILLWDFLDLKELPQQSS